MIIDEDTMYGLLREAKEAGVVLEITDGIMLSKFLAKALTSLGAKQEWERIVKADNDCIKDRAVFIKSYNERRERLDDELGKLQARCPHLETVDMASTMGMVDTFCLDCKGAIK